ncbi:cxxc_20_cxxc protein [Virgibacillus subterraneus]|uniref:Cxxc_20_cxxc protein n=2 Tax=Virgibacillus TaxID=84406 RepID=A0A1H0Y6Z8_9BACI|nr:MULTISPECIES: TIGR04104 family putative zinc finger protein [Virgibacillus]SDQ10870.1 cxxc_20_cxxc protein [Virgibacillus salinus]SEP69010.1 cxxc_20_cxxc protein [Virgibacillus subterraneus]
MPICQNCGNEWTWIQSVAAFKMKCPHCGKKQYETNKSRQIRSWLDFLPLAVFPITVLLDLSLWAVLVTIIAAVIASFIFHPSILKLSNKQEPFW